MPPESIKRRYAATFMTQILRWGLSFLVNSAIVPRCLGPMAYGNFNFITSASAAFRSFVDPCSQESFFTFSSQDQRSGPLTKLYGLVLLGQIFIVIALVSAAAWMHKLQWILPGQKLNQALWISILEWMIFLALSLQRLGDCKGQTVVPQVIGAGVSIANMLGLLGLYVRHKLNLYTYVWFGLASAFISIIALGYWLLGVHADQCWTASLSGQVRPLLKRWWRYASPLILVEYYSPIIAFFSTYLIQRWYGSAEQGNYALAARWSAPALAFTSAGLMIFWREIAHSTAAGERERAARIYMRFNRLLMFLALVLAFWLSFSNATLIPLLTGKQFAAAIPILTILAFYPVIQTSGHLTSASFKATERTTQFRNVSLSLSIPDVLLTYFLLARTDAAVPGLHLGAMGLAIKVMVLDFGATEIYSYLDCRYYGINYAEWFSRKLMVAALVGSAALITLKGLCWGLGRIGLPPLVALGLSSFVYVASMAGLVYARPGVMGLTPKDIADYFQIALNRMRATAFTMWRALPRPPSL